MPKGRRKNTEPPPLVANSQAEREATLARIRNSDADATKAAAVEAAARDRKRRAAAFMELPAAIDELLAFVRQRIDRYGYGTMNDAHLLHAADWSQLKRLANRVAQRTDDAGLHHLITHLPERWFAKMPPEFVPAHFFVPAAQFLSGIFLVSSLLADWEHLLGELRAATRPPGAPLRYPRAVAHAIKLMDDEHSTWKDQKIYNECKSRFGHVERLPNNAISFMRTVRRHRKLRLSRGR
jgi:hypothetical protein